MLIVLTTFAVLLNASDSAVSVGVLPPKAKADVLPDAVLEPKSFLATFKSAISVHDEPSQNSVLPSRAVSIPPYANADVVEPATPKFILS